MHVYFINYHLFQGTSGIHIHFLANSLVESGVECTVCVPGQGQGGHMPGRARYDTLSFSQVRRLALFRPGAFGPDTIFHAWTPRERVRRLTVFLERRLGTPYLVHLEDHEELVYRTHVHQEARSGLRGVLQRFLLPRRNFIHPQRYRAFLARAIAITCITESLREFVPPGLLSMTFWPACEPEFLALPQEPDRQVRRELSIPKQMQVVTYTGGVHAANREEVQTLYKAVVELNRKGLPVHLIRSGNTPPPLDRDVLAAARPHVTELGELPPDRLIHYIAAADILVQPGKPDPFNNYRFPSKIPMFLASARPVILPATNIGLHLDEGENCLLLRQGSVTELVEAMERLLQDQDMRQRIGQGGRRFVRRHLNWDSTAQQVLALYKRCLHGRAKG